MVRQRFGMYMHAKRQTRSMQRQSLQSPNLSGPDSGRTGAGWDYANASFIGVNEPGGVAVQWRTVNRIVPVPMTPLDRMGRVDRSKWQQHLPPDSLAINATTACPPRSSKLQANCPGVKYVCTFRPDCQERCNEGHNLKPPQQRSSENAGTCRQG